MDGPVSATINLPNPASDGEVVAIHPYVGTNTAPVSVTLATAQSGTLIESPQNPGNRTFDAATVYITDNQLGLLLRYDATNNLWSNYI